jgi:hypothetical protein
MRNFYSMSSHCWKGDGKTYPTSAIKGKLGLENERKKGKENLTIVEIGHT